MSSAICFNLDHSKILSSGNGLNFQVNNTTKQLLSMLRVVADKKINLTLVLRFVSEKVENDEKEESTVYQYYPFCLLGKTGQMH